MRFSELCWILRDHLDLSDILPISGTRERSLYYEELVSVLKPQGWTEAALKRELSKNFGRPFTLKFEFPRLKSSYYSIVKSVWHVQEKCYSPTVSTSYSRKRHILSTGLSTPFNMYLNEDLDESDKQYMKRRKIK